MSCDDNASSQPSQSERFHLEEAQDDDENNDDDDDDKPHASALATDQLAATQLNNIVTKPAECDCEAIVDRHAAAINELNALHKAELKHARELAATSLAKMRTDLVQASHNLAASNAKADELRTLLHNERSDCIAARSDAQLAQERASIAERAADNLAKLLADERERSTGTLAHMRQLAVETLRRHAEQLEHERAQSTALQRRLDELHREFATRLPAAAETLPPATTTTTTAITTDEPIVVPRAQQPMLKRKRVKEPLVTPPQTPPSRASAVILFTGFPRSPTEANSVRARYTAALESFGATVLENVGEHEFPDQVTHVVAGAGRTTKVLVALLRKVPLVHADWVDACIAANALVSTAPFARSLTNVNPLLGKTVHLTSSFLNGRLDQRNSYISMAHEICVAGKVRQVLEGDQGDEQGRPDVDYTIVGEEDPTVAATSGRLTFRQFVKLIDQ